MRSPRPSLRRSSFLATRAAFAAVAAVALLGCTEKQAGPPPPPEVYVAEVAQQDVPVYKEIVGQTAGSKDVEIRARVEGYLDSVNFREGSFVEKGQLLYQIDPQPFEAQLAQAKAQLADADARLKKADIDVARLTPLAEQQAVSKQELDNALSSQDAAKAQVAAGKAVVQEASLNLGYTRIAAPTAGLIDITKVKPGNLVGRGESTLLTTISVVDPLYFNGSVAEAEYLEIRKRYPEGQRSEQPVPIQLILADGTVHPHEGRLDAVQRAVDSKTGTLSVRFAFPNPERIVRPGQYGKARFIWDLLKDALLVPQRAVQELQGVYNIAVVGVDGKASIRRVEVGPRHENLWVITKGVERGDKVVVEGLQFVRDGAPVNAKPVAPSAPAEGK